jgi:tetratricopeptide (TPR) repeat protein
MRAMLGGSTLSGQALVRELRQRGELNLEQANALASFWDAKGRVEDVAYKPTLTDVGFARAGYNELGRAVSDTSAKPNAATSAASGSPISTFAPGGATASASSRDSTLPADAPPPSVAATTIPPSATRLPSSRVLIGIVVAVIVIVAGLAAYLTRGRSKFDGEMTNAISLMTTGRTEAARAAFGAIAHEYPDKAAPHVFLSRLARSDTPPDMNTARQELVTAIRLEPAYEPAQREMGIFQLASRNPSLARNFLIRAVQLAPADSAAQGYLGCALMGLNRIEDAQKFLARAGNGTWSSCTAPPTTPGTVSP